MRDPQTPDQLRFYAHVAHSENRILESHFPQTLRHSSFQWPEERARLMERLAQPPAPYVSPVSRHLITRFTQRQVSALLLALLLAAVAAERLAARRSPA